MKRFPLVITVMMALVLLAALVVLPGYNDCGKEYPESLNITITRQPVGGMNVGLVSCAYTVAYVKEQVDDESKYRQPEGVDLTVCFKNDRGSTYSEQDFHFNSSNTGGSKVISFQAPSGMYLDKTFWVEFKWQASGMYHSMESSKAVCKVR